MMILNMVIGWAEGQERDEVTCKRVHEFPTVDRDLRSQLTPRYSTASVRTFGVVIPSSGIVCEVFCLCRDK